MKNKYFKVGLVLSILVLGNMIAPAFGANPTSNSIIEKQQNDYFKNMISNLPEDTREPVTNTLNYIKKRSGCNDWEAAQINGLMAIHADQKQGYDYYSRYIRGNTTPEEDGADYYRAIRLEWDQFLEEYARMTPGQRSKALMTSATNEDVERILKDSSSEELDYVLNKADPYQKKIENLSNELSSKSTSWMIGHINSVKKSGNELNKTFQEYNEAIVAADKEWNINQNQKKNNFVKGFNPLGDSDLPYDDVPAYINILKACNALRGIGHDYNFSLVSEGGINKGDIVQYVVNSSDKNIPMYKYLMILDENNQTNTYEVHSMFLTALNVYGDEITEDKNDLMHDVKRLRYEAWDPPYENYSKDDVNYWGSYAIHTIYTDGNFNGSLRDIYTIYANTDPTGLEDRIKNVVARPDTGLKTGGIAGISVGGISLVTGVLLVGAGILALCGVITSAFGVNFILSGIVLIISGVIGIVTSDTNLKTYNKGNSFHNSQNSNIINDIKKFNGKCVHV